MNSTWWYHAVIALGASLTIGLVTLPIIIRLGHRYGLLDQPGRHKRHKQPTPYLGGLALWLSVWGTFLIIGLVSRILFSEISGSIGYVMAGATIVFLVGLADDLRPISPWLKLLVEIAAGLILYAGGLRIDPVSIPFDGQWSLGPLSLVITVVWVVLLTNAINLIDGLDGLAAGVSLVGAGSLAVVGGLYGVTAAMLPAYALIGFLAAFLVYNRYPARIFLGDSGSLQIGFYFAVISLTVPLKSYTAAALYLPLVGLGVPLLETAVSFFRRIAAGKSIMRADRRHLFHYLAYAGLTPRQIVSVFYALSLIFGLFAVAMYFWDRVLVVSVMILFMVVIFGAFSIFMANVTRFKNGGVEKRR